MQKKETGNLLLFIASFLKSILYFFENSLSFSLEFLKLCRRLNKRLWIRQVIVPGINDNEEYIRKLKKFLEDYNVEKVEFLPYTTIGVPKYEKLGIPYRLNDTKAMDKLKCEELYKLYQSI